MCMKTDCFNLLAHPSSEKYLNILTVLFDCIDAFCHLFTLDKTTDAIIYELHKRDLSMDPSSNIHNKGKFLGLTEEGTKDSYGNPTGLEYLFNARNSSF